MVLSMPLTFALLAVSLAHEDITFLKARNLSEVEEPAKMAGGQSDVWKPVRENPVVKRAEEETSRAWNALWNNSWVRNAVNQTETDTTYAWKLAENNTVLKPIVHEMENTYSQLTNVSTGNATVPDVEQMETPGWNVGALLCTAILLLCPACCCGLCALTNYISFPMARKKEYDQLDESSEATSHTEGGVSATHLPNFNWCYHHWVSRLWNFDDLQLSEVLRQEVLLMLICPCLALLAAPWTTCEEGAPSWIYIVYLMTRFDSEWTHSTWLAFALWGPLDHLDWFTDGSAPVQALACDMNGFHITDRWASAWDSSSAGWFVPVVQTFHVWGLIFLVFCIAAAWQQFLGAAVGGPSAETTQADLAAMQGLAELSSRASIPGAKGERLIFVGVAKVAMENVPQLLLQTSFLALVFDQLTPLGRAKVLLSILLGLASASQKLLEGVRELVRQISRYAPPKDCVDWCFVSVFSAIFMLAAVAVLWTVVKLYFIFHCDTHLWNLGSGCVEWT